MSLPDRRYDFAAELFARALERGASDADALTAVARDAGGALARRQRRGRAGKKRALSVLAQSGYEPVVDGDGTIRLRNCPFHALASTHRDLTCGMNLALAEGMLEGLGADGLNAELDPRPGWCCVVLRDDDQTAPAQSGADAAGPST